MKRKAQYIKMIESKIIETYLYYYKNRLYRNAIKIRPVLISGSGRFSKYSVDHTKKYTDYLESKGINYQIGNDAPRGGKKGKYIEIVLDMENDYIFDIIYQYELNIMIQKANIRYINNK